jgi:hypothetical protein
MMFILQDKRQKKKSGEKQNTPQRAIAWAPGVPVSVQAFTRAEQNERLQLAYVFGLRTAVSLYHSERDLLAFVQGLEAFTANSAVMDEYVPAVVGCDEPITFFRIKPLYCSCWHPLNKPP